MSDKLSCFQYQYIRICFLAIILLFIPSSVLAQESDELRVIVALRPPPAGDVATQAVQIARTQEAVLDEISTDDFQVSHRFATVPGMAGIVTEEGLTVLANNPNVVAVDVDQPVSIALSGSTDLIRVDEVRADYGLTGEGVRVAVLDTGIDPSHPDLADSLVRQKCFNHDTCPPDDSDESSSALDEQGHGTHVAGIITSNGTVAGQGVAPDAEIVAVRVLNANGSGWTSDVVLGMEWVVANQAELQVQVMNLSLGGGRYDNVCDDENANTLLYQTAVAAAREAGIVVVAASGNDGFANDLMAPACVSGVLAVGNVYDEPFPLFNWPTCAEVDILADHVTCSSNSSGQLDLLAPGTDILSTALGGGEVSQSGTSMSTPHVAGIAALLFEADPTLTVSEVEQILLETGEPITDTRNGRVRPRVDALNAVARVLAISPTPTPTATLIAGTVLRQGGTDHSGTEIYLSTETCDAATFDSPISVTNENGEFSIPSEPTVASGYQCLRASAPSYLPAEADQPQGDLGSVTLLNGDLSGDGIINIFDISMIASAYGADTATADLNGNGTVDIFDLSIAAANYEATVVRFGDSAVMR